MTQLAQPPGVAAPWQVAMDSHMSALKLINHLTNHSNDLDSRWAVDKLIMEDAVPFSWSTESIEAVLAASRTIPPDTVLNVWNLDTNAAWWYFDQELPFPTINGIDGIPPEIASKTGVKAMSIGWVLHAPEVAKFPAGTDVRIVERAIREGPPKKRMLAVASWLLDPLKRWTMIPSQTMQWELNDSLEELMRKSKTKHQHLYGPGGKWERVAHVHEDVFMNAAEGMARFILAGLAWLNQKVPILVQSEGHIERHRRKEYQKKVNPSVTHVKVISLRRVERQKAADPDTAPGAKREYSVRFPVDGHWRNQPYGPKRHERRLIWISPFIKGPADKPLRVPEHKIYKVNR